METLYLVAGLLAGGLTAWFLSKYLTKTHYLENVRDLENQVNSEKQQRISAETRLEERIKSWDEANKTVKQVFDATASDALKSNNKAFLELAEQTLKSYIAESKGDLSKRQEVIEQMLKPFKESLDKHEFLAKDMEKSTKETFGGLKIYLEQLKESQQSLTKETNALVTALKSPKVRGRWGEIGLKRIVEFSGMSAYCDFDEQQSVTTEDGRLRPDMIVRLPGKRSVIVDSKTPLNAYLESLEEEDENIKKGLLAKHAEAVREHMVKLSSKAYWSQFDNTVDFVVLYIEIESAFGAALIQDRELILDGIKNKVIFATPTTLITLLKTVAFSWAHQEIAENAGRIWETGKELFERICIFTGHLADMGKGIKGAVESYNSAIGSWESRVTPSAKKLKELSISSAKRELPELNEVEIKTREIRQIED